MLRHDLQCVVSKRIVPGKNDNDESGNRDGQIGENVFEWQDISDWAKYERFHDYILNRVVIDGNLNNTQRDQMSTADEDVVINCVLSSL